MCEAASLIPAPRRNFKYQRVAPAPPLDTLRLHHQATTERAGGTTAGATRVKAQVLIRPKQGILDPQGQAVEEALPALGFKGVSHVHVGRLIELEVEDPSQIDAMCEKLLANPLIEDYEIEQ